MMKQQGTLLAVTMAIALILIGCTSKPQVLTQNFVTDITNDGSKRFELSLELSKQKPAKNEGENGKSVKRGPGKGRSSGAAMGNDRQTESLAELLEERLQLVMAETGFCEQGYMVFERNLSREFLSVRGECNEGVES
ncbi:hypothetical protein [Thalassotalea sp. PS06]|uniref:hypothetical protein n=1 Tax=Thalassotalea sp. PS06 TaxID=2594005 RepID=UPI0011641938|nr:hypothetical protein [Thalassotalea sp. PS06]QDP02614.1 hypothetical protein FNC98_15430 [Thalassotalea sp. PS06]